jgi:hypothetical protein
MAIDYSKTTLFEGTPEISELKTENKNLVGLNTLLVLSLIIVGAIIAINYVQDNEENVNGTNDK